MKLFKRLVCVLVVIAVGVIFLYKVRGAHQANQSTSAELARIQKVDYLKEYHESKDYDLNENIVLGDLEFQVLMASNADKIRVNNKNFFPHGLYKIVKVKVQNNDTYARNMDYDMFQIVDNKNNIFNADINLSQNYNNGSNERFFNSELNPTLGEQGYIVFDLPKNSGNSYKIRLKDSRYSLDEANVIIK